MIKLNKKLNTLAFTLVFGVIFFPGIKSLASDITSGNVINLVNKARNIQGLIALKENPKLDKVASDKLQDMVENKYFAHTSPQGATPWSWFFKNKYDYEYAGENLAIDFMTAEKQHEAWMKSETHKKNILSPNFTEIGVAVGAGEIENHLSIITVQVFGRPAISSATANKEENFTSAFKSSSYDKGMVLASREMKIEKADNIKSDSNSNSLAYFVEEGSRWTEFAWIVSWIILVMALIANPLIIVANIFKIKSGARKLTGKLEISNNYLDQRQFR